LRLLFEKRKMRRCRYLLVEKTMKTLPLEASDQEILDAVREWVGLLIEERYTDAYEFLSHEERSHGWTPELIATLIQNYGSPEPLESTEVFKVTSLEDAKVDPPRYMPLRQDVHRYGKHYPEGYIWFDLPLNGYASDLTATLEFRVRKNHFVFELTDIHVM
jgi:hypothetical protein